MKTLKYLVTFSIILSLCVPLILGCSNKNKVNNEPNSIQTTNTQPEIPVTPTIMPTPTPTVDDTPMVPLIPMEVEPSSSAQNSNTNMDLSKLPGGILKLKMENGEVKVLQERLKALGYLDKVTGYFGTDTENAVKEFQKKNNLDADGIVGSGTWKVMTSSDAVSA